MSINADNRQNIKFRALLNTHINYVVAFVNECYSCSFDIDVTQGNNRHIIDGRSIVGVMSLNLNNPVEIHCMTENKQDVERFIQNLMNKGIPIEY